MYDIVLSDSLIDEYLKFKFNDPYDKDKIRRLLKLIHPFCIRENHPLIKKPFFAKQLLYGDPLISIINSSSESEILNLSVLKLKLTDKPENNNFTTININNDNEKLSSKFTARCESDSEKEKARKHIKDLISCAKWIRIIDAYIAGDDNQWSENKRLIQGIIPCKEIDLTIQGAHGVKDSILNPEEKKELNSICPKCNIKSQAIGKNIHDRYIETNKLRILLSSGLYHLSTSSSKDFTYVVEVK